MVAGIGRDKGRKWDKNGMVKKKMGILQNILQKE